MMPAFLSSRWASWPCLDGLFLAYNLHLEVFGAATKEETTAMTNLELNQNEPEIMRAIPPSYLSDPHLEVAGPEKKAFRDELKQKEVFQKHVLECLQAA